MPKPSNEEIVRRYVAAHTAHDYDTVGALRDPEWTVEWPQSGERVRGGANDRAIMGAYKSGALSNLPVWTTFVAMGAAAIAPMAAGTAKPMLR